MPIKAVIFDFYGTLISINEKNNPYKPLLGMHEEMRKLFLTSDTSCFEEAFLSLSINLSPNIARKIEEDISREIKSVTVYEDVFPILEWLRLNGYKIGLISNLATPYKQPFFQLGFPTFFDEYLFSCDAGLVKPDEKIYQMMLRRLGLLPEEVLFIGDSLRCDFVGPSMAGLNSILLDRLGQKDFSKKIRSLLELKEILTE